MAVKYSPEIAQKILKRLAAGRESLRQICADDDMPDESTVRGWAANNKDFAPHYAQARLAGYLVMADDITSIADDGTNDFQTRNVRGELVESVDSEHINRSRLRVDTRKWILSKVLPKIYGDRIAVEHSGSVSIEDRLRAGRKRVGGSE